jgi:hypothetical protein
MVVLMKGNNSGSVICCHDIRRNYCNVLTVNRNAVITVQEVAQFAQLVLYLKTILAEFDKPN